MGWQPLDRDTARKGRNAGLARPPQRRAELVENFGAEHSMSEPDADKKAEMPEQPGKVGGGTAEGTDAARQADTACDEHAEDQIPVTMEEVLSRENMWRLTSGWWATRALRASTA